MSFIDNAENKKKDWKSSLDDPNNVVNSLSAFSAEQITMAAKHMIKEIESGTVNRKIAERKRSFETSEKHASMLSLLKPFIQAMLTANYSVKMINERLNHKDGITMPLSVEKGEDGATRARTAQVVISVPYSQLLSWIKSEPELCKLVKTKKSKLRK